MYLNAYPARKNKKGFDSKATNAWSLSLDCWEKEAWRENATWRNASWFHKQCDFGNASKLKTVAARRPLEKHIWKRCLN